MTKITSVDKTTTDNNSNNQIVKSYSLGGTPDIKGKITDPLLTNLEVAESRATSELLKSGYITKRVQFDTYYVDGLELGMLIEVRGIKYIVVNIKIIAKDVKVSMSILAERYDR